MVTDEIRSILNRRESEIQQLITNSEVEDGFTEKTTDLDGIERLYVDLLHVGERPKLSMYSEPFELKISLKMDDTDDLLDLKKDMYALLKDILPNDIDPIVSQDYPSHSLTTKQELSKEDIEYILDNI